MCGFASVSAQNPENRHRDAAGITEMTAMAGMVEKRGRRGDYGVPAGEPPSEDPSGALGRFSSAPVAS